MARIFDNIDQDLLGTLRATMQVSRRSDFCVGYLNLRGWQAIDDLIVPWDPALGQFLVGKWLMRVFEDGKLLDERTFEIIS